MSALPNTYSGIITSVKELAENDDTEFETYIPKALFLAEERLYKDLDMKRFKKNHSVSVPQGTYIVNKPTNYRYAYNVLVEDSLGNASLLKKRSEDYIVDYWPNASVLGEVKYYSDEDEDTFRLAPAPSEDVTLRVTYNELPTKLSSSNQTNYFTEYHPDALFYATMSAMAEFMKDYTTLRVWESKLTVALQGGILEGKVYNKEDGTPHTNPDNPEQEK